MLPKVIECSDTLDFLHQLERMGRKTWIYRGQSRYSAEASSDWKLESSLLRFINQHKTSIKSSRWLKVPIPHASPWVEFVFPNQGAAYYTMLNQLSKAGMSAKVLFPDLQGVCESLKFSWLEASTDLEPSQDAP